MLDIKIELEGKAVPIKTRDDLQKFIRFVGTYLQYTADMESPAVAPVPTVAVPRHDSTPVPIHQRNGADLATRNPGALGKNPPIGERKVDYAVGVLEKEGKPLSTQQMAERMIHLGWKPKEGSRRQQILTAAYSTLHDYTDRFYQAENGAWALCGWESSFPPKKKADAPSSANEESMEGLTM